MQSADYQRQQLQQEPPTQGTGTSDEDEAEEGEREREREEGKETKRLSWHRRRSDLFSSSLFHLADYPTVLLSYCLAGWLAQRIPSRSLSTHSKNVDHSGWPISRWNREIITINEGSHTSSRNNNTNNNDNNKWNQLRWFTHMYLQMPSGANLVANIMDTSKMHCMYAIFIRTTWSATLVTVVVVVVATHLLQLEQAIF